MASSSSLTTSSTTPSSFLFRLLMLFAQNKNIGLIQVIKCATCAAFNCKNIHRHQYHKGGEYVARGLMLNMVHRFFCSPLFPFPVLPALPLSLPFSMPCLLSLRSPSPFFRSSPPPCLLPALTLFSLQI